MYYSDFRPTTTTYSTSSYQQPAAFTASATGGYYAQQQPTYHQQQQPGSFCYPTTSSSYVVSPQHSFQQHSFQQHSFQQPSQQQFVFAPEESSGLYGTQPSVLTTARQISSPVYQHSASYVPRTISGPSTRTEAAGGPVTTERHLSSRTYVTDLPPVHSSTRVMYKTADGRTNFYTTNHGEQTSSPLGAARPVNMSGSGITYHCTPMQPEPVANFGLAPWAQEIESSLQAAGMPAAAPPQ